MDGAKDIVASLELCKSWLALLFLGRYEPEGGREGTRGEGLDTHLHSPCG
uniref:Uncharacterized protein n=1 Tax=Arundo donax TaxID=35708 RepID=A0A0A9EYL0_ARUDO